MNKAAFQDRKLNACVHCNTKKRIALHTRPDGSLYFLCEGASRLLDLMVKDAAKAGIQL